MRRDGVFFQRDQMRHHRGGRPSAEGVIHCHWVQVLGTCRSRDRSALTWELGFLGLKWVPCMLDRDRRSRDSILPPVHVVKMMRPYLSSTTPVMTIICQRSVHPAMHFQGTLPLLHCELQMIIFSHHVMCERRPTYPTDDNVPPTMMMTATITVITGCEHCQLQCGFLRLWFSATLDRCKSCIYNASTNRSRSD